MERKNKANQRKGEIRWRKEGGGSFRTKINGKDRIIKPGETFRALPEEIPLAFRDVVVPLDKVPEAAH